MEYSGILSNENANGYTLSMNTSRNKPPPNEVSTSQRVKSTVDFLKLSAFLRPCRQHEAIPK